MITQQERFSNPRGRAHGHALDRVNTTGGDKAVQYGRVKIGQKRFLNTGIDKLPRLCDMAVGNPTKTALKNQQASIKGLKTQIGQLAKLISERPQGSLPSNTKTNPREQLNTITIREEEGLVELEPELKQGLMVSKGKDEVDHSEKKSIDELDKWRTYVNEKPKAHDESKRHLDKCRNETAKFKAEDKVLLDEKDPLIATSEFNTNGATPFTVLNVFSYGAVEVNHSQFGTFKENITRLKLYEENRIDSRSEEFQLLNPP
ncbi:hypothetical protein GOBAR_AA34620 [Gossypium barbadense]|uniref:Uncharacterized protein n=1 Tax=Gossypium barbadense TaxID=3634 RepID=A0A2P5W4S0_GOSBA|nr:hypothetical protein GOBAR_AA34620 [Gossypium barbadense]